MKYLTKGQYFGDTKNVIQIDNLILTESEFTRSNVDWHYHENLHFSYSLCGESCQISKKEKYFISSGVLIYHNSEDPHLNTNHSKYSKNFYIEIEKEWLDNLCMEQNLPKGILNLDNPSLKIAIDQIYYETKINDNSSQIVIESILIDALVQLMGVSQFDMAPCPGWVTTLKEIVHTNPDVNFSLKNLSKKVGIHPVHLSRQFPKHFGQSFSQYIRSVKVHRAASLLKNRELSLADVCYMSGFFDQSHLGRCFKNVFNTTPLQYRKTII